MLSLLKKSFVSLNEDKVMSIAPRCLNAGLSKSQIVAVLNEALEEIGDLYKKEIYTLSDLMMAGIIYEEVVKKPEFEISSDIIKSIAIGKIVHGTIDSDIDNLGKSIFISITSAAGFDVIDIGVDVHPETFCDYVKKYDPEILAISAILNSAIPHIKETIDLLIDHGLRDGLKILIGGRMMTPEICEYVGADGYNINPLRGLEICWEWLDNNGTY